MNRQEELEELLVNICPVCKSSDHLYEAYITDIECPIEQILEVEAKLSSEWQVTICSSCQVSWAVPSWTAVGTENLYER